MSVCQKELMKAGKPYPRTCPTCGLSGFCRKEGLKVNNYQVGGDHYRCGVQHWDYVELNRLGYLEGCALKYVTRSRKKHKSPIEDLSKAVHYCRKLQSLHLAVNRTNDRFPEVISSKEFAKENKLNDKEAQVVTILSHWGDASDLQDAIELLEQMLGEAQQVGGPR